MSNKSGNFFTAHYEWLALVVALIVLAVAGVYVVSEFGKNADKEKAAVIRGIDPASKSRPSGVKAANLDEHVRIVGMVRKPIYITEIKETEASFLSPEKRMTCKFCTKPIRFGLEVCPFCGKKLPEKKAIVLDADGDGLPDEWERRYGLNPDDPSDANADADNDGFTNMEEYLAKTDPKDSKSHPDYLDSLKLELPLKETFLPFYFVSAMKTPSGVKLEFSDPKRRNDYGKLGYRYSILEGADIGDTGFVAKKYTQKSEKRKIEGGSGMERTVDISTVTLVRKSDNKTITLRIEEKRKPLDVQAKLVYSRNGKVEEFTVVPGSVISLNGTKFAVKSIRSKAKGASITLEEVETKRNKTLEALET